MSHEIGSLSASTGAEQSRAERATAELSGAGYRHQWTQAIKGTRSRIECWTGQRGVLMVQVWEAHRHGHNPGRESITIYSECGVPMRWDELAIWLVG